MRRTLCFLLILALIYPPGLKAVPESASLSFQNLSVPASLGKIKERFQGTTNHWVIQIQDVHAHFTAQENIAAIIDHLNRLYGIKTVAMEGGWSETSFKKSWGIPTSREKQLLARALLEEEYITGPAYTALFSKTPLHLIGIEEKELYQDNHSVYLTYLKEKEIIAVRIAEAVSRLENQKKQTLNSDLLSFDQSLSDFREGEKAEKFLPALMFQAQTQNMNTSSLDQIQLFQQMLELETQIDRDRLNEEANRLTGKYGEGRLSFEEVLRNSKVPENRIRFYPQTQIYIELMGLQDQMDHHTFFLQIEQVIRALETKLAGTEAEKKLMGQSRRFALAKKILTLQATPEDLKAYQEEKGFLDSEIEAYDLGSAFELAKKFYAIVLKRDEAFFEKITRDPRFSGNLAIVTGGFHTDGLSRLLREAGISYITITPEIGDTPHNEELYYERIQDIIAETQTFAHIQNRFFPEAFDERFAQGLLILRDTNDIRSAVNFVITGQTAGSISAAGQSVKQTVSAPSLSTEAFLALSTEEQKQTLLKLVSQNAEAGNVLAVTTQTLETLYEQDALTQQLWQQVRGQQKGTVVIVYQNSIVEVPSWALVSGRGKVSHLQAENIGQATQAPRFSRLFGPDLATGRVAAIASQAEALKKEVRALPVQPVSLLIYLTGLYHFAQNSQAMNVLFELLRDTAFMQQLLQSA